MSTINMPGFTAENSVYQTRTHHCMATAFDSKFASAKVQAARKRGNPLYCRPFLNLFLDAYRGGDELWAAFWWGGLMKSVQPNDQSADPVVRINSRRPDRPVPVP